MISAKRKEEKRKDKPEIYTYLLPPMSKDCQDISLLLSSLLLPYLHGIKKTPVERESRIGISTLPKSSSPDN